MVLPKKETNMNLPSSLVVTAIITLGIWLAVAFQPQAANQFDSGLASNAAQSEPSAASSIATSSFAASTTGSKPATGVENTMAASSPLTASASAAPGSGTHGIVLVGVSAEIALTEVGGLWTKLNQDPRFAANLSTATPTMYAYYRDFNSDYSIANVSVGYSSKDINLSGLQQITLHEGEYQVLAGPGLYEQAELLSAWQKIDYQRSVLAVLERHKLTAQGEISSSALSVLYKN
jgi:hypothetical protein